MELSLCRCQDNSLFQSFVYQDQSSSQCLSKTRQQVSSCFRERGVGLLSIFLDFEKYEDTDCIKQNQLVDQNVEVHYLIPRWENSVFLLASQFN